MGVGLTRKGTTGIRHAAGRREERAEHHMLGMLMREMSVKRHGHHSSPHPHPLLQKGPVSV